MSEYDELEEDFNLENFSDEESAGESSDSSNGEESCSTTDEECVPEEPQFGSGVNFLTKFEKARVLAVRAEQIMAGTKVFVEVNPPTLSAYEIALKELKEKKMPLLVRRYFGHGKSEDISVNKLILLD